MSWAADSQLVRGSVSGFNLAIGEPHFLREVFAPYYPRHYPADLGYPDSRPSDELLRELQILHPGQEIVVTLGAKQALHAAAHALRSFSHTLSHRKPYWPTYPTIAEYAGLDFQAVPEEPRRSVLVCNTSPNNPDGGEDLSPCDVWDAAYAHGVYGWSGQAPEHRISVWSAGKMLGNPGVRVGWLCTREPEIAEAARRYVEQQTSGVPTISQHHVAATLRNTAHNRQALYAQARRTLQSNAVEVSRLSPYLVGHHTGRGMFAWVRPLDPAYFAYRAHAAGVHLVYGDSCGMIDWFRLSLGNDVLTTRAAVDTLIAHLERENP